jgi:hypothetical protein
MALPEMWRSYVETLRRNRSDPRHCEGYLDALRLDDTNIPERLGLQEFQATRRIDRYRLATGRSRVPRPEINARLPSGD